MRSPLRKRYGRANSTGSVRYHAIMPGVAIPRFNPLQFLFFALTSRRPDARVVAMDISKDSVARAARAVGGIVKGGYLLDGQALIGEGRELHDELQRKLGR